MIRLLKSGHYSLVETKNQTKILTLDEDLTFIWINAENIGEILITSHKTHKSDTILALGKYRLYGVKDEPDFTDLVHLELFVGEGKWQGYLLPNGLPTRIKKKNRIIPTSEIITQSPKEILNYFVPARVLGS